MAPRFLQILWVLAIAFFGLSLVRILVGGDTKSITDWVLPKTPLAPVTPVAPAAPAAPAAPIAPIVPGVSKEISGSRLSLAEHMILAETIWAKTRRQRHELMKEWKDPDHMPFFPADSVHAYEEHPYTIWDLVPASYSCPHEMERIGRMGDGGKWVCGFSRYEQIAAERPCVVYSFGVQTESSYEEETLSRTHCEVWAYDYSVVDFGSQLSASHRSRAHFKQAGISGENKPENDPPFYTIQELMKQNGHSYIDILKIDIEYSEFLAITSLNAAFPASAGHTFPIGQILIELHLFGQENFGITTGEFIKWWESLEDRGFRPAFTEPNLLYTTLRIEDGDPRLAEYTLINTNDPNSVLF